MNTTQETVTAWLQEVSGGEENFQFRDDGVYTYAVSDELQATVEIPEAGEVVHFYATVAGLPEEDLEAFYARVLRMNLLTLETRGATLALDDRRRGIVLCYTAPVSGLDVVSFGNLLGNFIESATHVREALGDVAPAQAQAASASDSEPLLTGIRA